MVTVDDGFFFLAAITLIAGTATCYIDIPYLYEQNNVTPGTTVITPEFIQLLLRSLRIQTAADFLFSVTLFLVKLSFLFFFHGLLRRVRGLTIWWWCVLGMTVPLNILFICCIFIVCPHYDESVLGGSAFVQVATQQWIHLLAAHSATTDRPETRLSARQVGHEWITQVVGNY